MPICAFLTTHGLDGFVVDDALAHPHFEALGWRVVEVEWRRSTDWRAFQAVVIRSTWDYMEDPTAFLRTLERVRTSGTPLLNSLPLVRWNLEKTYLQVLQESGVPVVPSVWGRGTPDLAGLFRRLDTERLVVKPVVGANATDTFDVPAAEAGSALPGLEATFARRPFLAQPFMAGVLEEGEYSLFFFDGAYSHAVLKRPADGDFRTQEEHGARIEAVEAGSALREAGARALAAVPERPLYARVDLVRAGGGFAVMELELVEPSLYLRMDSGAPARFARAFHDWMARGGPAT